MPRALAGNVMWDLHVGHIDFSASHANEQDTKGLWHAGEVLVKKGRDRAVETHENVNASA